MTHMEEMFRFKDFQGVKGPIQKKQECNSLWISMDNYIADF